MSDVIAIDVDPDTTQRWSYPSQYTMESKEDKNAHLKGRRRYNADLHDIKQECELGFAQHGYTIKKLRSGDDENSIDLTIYDLQGEHILALTLLISDTSDYPKSHQFFSYSQDLSLSPHIINAVESISSGPSRTIKQALQKILVSLGNPAEPGLHLETQSQKSSIEDDETSNDDYDVFDEFNENTILSPKLHFQEMRSDFIEVVAMGYRPGIIHFGDDDFAISISLPVITLSKSIPPRALMAWDRRLFSRSQHLTLLISGFRGIYPPINSNGTYIPVAQHVGTTLKFKVGLTRKYKPGKEYAKDAGRTFGLISQDVEDELRIPAEKVAAMEASIEHEFDTDSSTEFGSEHPASLEHNEDEDDEGRFDRFSLSSSLESLLDHSLLKVIQLRQRFSLGWAGAEILLTEMEKSQVRPEDIFHTKRLDILAADEEEIQIGQTNQLPHDPLLGLNNQDGINLILTAFCYLVRRLSLCTRYCIVCHNKLSSDFEALKPYVCSSKLCAYQYYSLNQGPSLEYEIIHNPQTVDLLVSMAYSAATEQIIDEPLPVGMGLRVPLPDIRKFQNQLPRPVDSFNLQSVTTSPSHLPEHVAISSDGLCNFDDLSLPMMRASIAHLIDSLPAVDDMKKHLERKVRAGRAKPRLRDSDPSVIPAAWAVLRWCVASCTAHLEEITSAEESIKNIDPEWRQFRFSVGAPDAEAKFRNAITEAQTYNVNAQRFPSLYAFHGSPLRNWHSIIRHGLWYKSIAHGRAYGDGVYLAKDGRISMGHYAQAGRSMWRKSKISPTNCVALAEIVNLPDKFVSKNPYFVIKDTHWIMCRYLLVKGLPEVNYDGGIDVEPPGPSVTKEAPLVKLDPSHPITLNNEHIKIPEPQHRIDALLLACQEEYREECNDLEDLAIFEGEIPYSEVVALGVRDYMDEDVGYTGGGGYTSFKSAAVSTGKRKRTDTEGKMTDDWNPDLAWVTKSIENLIPPPVEATPSATMAVQRELKALLKEQQSAKSLKALGWYMPSELIGDNLFQWIVEMHSFEESLPIARDMKSKNLNSVIFEIRFPPSFPLAPPFFRIVTPRFLPFIQGGGGHITGGGSICMDLLTSDGWLPSYSVAAVLIQIKLAISNLDPRPARLSSDFDRPYSVREALAGYKRAAVTHGWQVPPGIEKIVC